MTLLSELRTGILLARRARYVSSSLWLVLTVLCLSLMASQFSGRQPATVAVDVGFSAMRLLLPLLIILLTQELISREFDRRYFLSSLTYPRPRHWFLLGRMTAILLLVFGVMSIMAITLAWVCSLIGLDYEQTTPPNLGSYYWIMMGFFSLDLFVITAFACLIAIVASTPSFVLIGTLGFMLISRSYSNVVALLERNQTLVEDSEHYQQSLAVLNYIFPDLAALDIRIITLYNRLELLPIDWPATLASTLAYGFALTIIAIFLLYKKRFN